MVLFFLSPPPSVIQDQTDQGENDVRVKMFSWRKRRGGLHQLFESPPQPASEDNFYREKGWCRSGEGWSLTASVMIWELQGLPHAPALCPLCSETWRTEKDYRHADASLGDGLGRQDHPRSKDPVCRLSTQNRREREEGFPLSKDS